MFVFNWHDYFWWFWFVRVYYMYALCIWRCERYRFCVGVFMCHIYIYTFSFIHSFIHTWFILVPRFTLTKYFSAWNLSSSYEEQKHQQQRLVGFGVLCVFGSFSILTRAVYIDKHRGEKQQQPKTRTTIPTVGLRRNECDEKHSFAASNLKYIAFICYNVVFYISNHFKRIKLLFLFVFLMSNLTSLFCHSVERIFVAFYGQK